MKDLPNMLYNIKMIQNNKKREHLLLKCSLFFAKEITYAFSAFISTLTLLYAGQSSVLLHELIPKATNNPTAATNKKAFFITRILQYN